MPEEIRNYQTIKPKRQGGCLKGCLIALLVFIILAGCGVGAYFAGRAYVKKQLPVWEERYPVIAIARELLDMKSEPDTEGGKFEASGKRQEGANDKSLLPKDIPLHNTPLAETFSISETQGTVYQRLAGSPDEVLEYTRKTMTKEGWVLKAEEEMDGDHLIIWQKADNICKTEIVDNEGNSELWLRYSKGSQKK